MSEQFEHHMSDADALMWNVERDPALRSTIVTTLLLDKAPDWEQLLARIERGTRLIPRMRQRVVEPALRLGPPAWSADPGFDLSYHVRRMRAPDPASFSIVLDVAATASMGDFDRARPLWEYTVIEGLPDERAALVIKVHHSMTDGVGGMKLLLMLFDLEREPTEAGVDPDPVDLPVFTPVGLMGQSLAYQQRRLTETAGRAMSSVRSAVRAVRDDAMQAIDRGARAADSIVRYLAPATSPMSPTINARSLDRRASVLEVPLDTLKRGAKAAGGSLNDAFVAAVVGGLRRYHDERHGECDELRMVMPINLRGDGAALGGNHFTPARLVVPMDIEDPAERIRTIGELTRRLRNEPAVALTEPIAAVLNRMPRRIATKLFGSMLKGADFVTSNVPGAPFPMYVCGCEVQRIYAFAPLSGTAANITLLSHCGTCCIGINTDARAIPDTDRFTSAIEVGFAEITALA